MAILRLPDGALLVLLPGGAVLRVERDGSVHRLLLADEQRGP